MATDGCHGLPSRMKTNKLASTDPSRWRAREIEKSQGEGAQAWHQYRYAIGNHLRNHPQSPWDEKVVDAVAMAAKLPHVADAQAPDADLNAPFCTSRTVFKYPEIDRTALRDALPTAGGRRRQLPWKREDSKGAI